MFDAHGAPKSNAAPFWLSALVLFGATIIFTLVVLGVVWIAEAL